MLKMFYFFGNICIYQFFFVNLHDFCTCNNVACGKTKSHAGNPSITKHVNYNKNEYY